MLGDILQRAQEGTWLGVPRALQGRGGHEGAGRLGGLEPELGLGLHQVVDES